jgi:hypothetical protein
LLYRSEETNVSNQIPDAAREAGRRAAQAKLANLMPGQTGIIVANEVADAVLEAAWACGSPVGPKKAECPVCGRTYRTRADDQVRVHAAPRSVHPCAGSPKGDS